MLLVCHKGPGRPYGSLAIVSSGSVPVWPPRVRPPWVVRGLALWHPMGSAGDRPAGCSSLGSVCPVVVLIELTLLLVSDEARAVAVVSIHILPAVTVAPILLDDDFVLVFGWFVHRANIQKSPERISRLLYILCDDLAYSA